MLYRKDSIEKTDQHKWIGFFVIAHTSRLVIFLYAANESMHRLHANAPSLIEEGLRPSIGSMKYLQNDRF